MHWIRKLKGRITQDRKKKIILLLFIYRYIDINACTVQSET
jgi:hypothetical protein